MEDPRKYYYIDPIVGGNDIEILLAPMALAKSLENVIQVLIKFHNPRQKDTEKEKEEKETICINNSIRILTFSRHFLPIRSTFINTKTFICVLQTSQLIFWVIWKSLISYF